MDAVYIAYYPDLTFPGAAETVGRLADMAVAAGAKRLVLLSLRNDEAAHRAEQRVRDSGADWTILRCAFFNQNFSEMFAEVIAMGRLAMPAGESTEPFIDANDIADVAATALTGDSHAGQIDELTGPRLLTLSHTAAELGAAMGREVQYVPTTVGEYSEELLSYDLSAEEAELVAQLFGRLLDGRNSYVAGGVRRALGRDARDFTDWASDAAAAGAWDLDSDAGGVA